MDAEVGGTQAQAKQPEGFPESSEEEEKKKKKKKGGPIIFKGAWLC